MNSLSDPLNIHGRVKTMTVVEYDHDDLANNLHDKTYYSDSFAIDGRFVHGTEFLDVTTKDSLILTRKLYDLNNIHDSFVYNQFGLITTCYHMLRYWDNLPKISRYIYESTYNLTCDSFFINNQLDRYTIYNYNIDGYLLEKTEYLPKGLEFMKITYQYDPNNVLTKSFGHSRVHNKHRIYHTEDDYINADDAQFEYVHEHDMQGNITKKTGFIRLREKTIFPQLTTYTYQYY